MLLLYSLPSPLLAGMVRHTTYDSAGRVISVDGPREDVIDSTHYNYDVQGNLTEILNPLGHKIRLDKHDGFGNPRSFTDFNNVQTLLEYDAAGRLVSSRKDNATSRYAYDTLGNITRITQPNGTWIDYRYDDVQRLSRITNPLGETIDYKYDSMGNVISEEVRDGASKIVKRRIHEYDERGRLLNIIGASGQVEKIRHDAADNPVNIKNPRGFSTTNRFDEFDRLVHLQDRMNGSVHYKYDSENRPIEVSDPRGVTTHIDYDELGNVTKLVSPDSGITAFTYDAASNLIKSVDGRGIEAEYHYDALNRLTERNYPSAPFLNSSFTYDNTSNGNKGIGRITGIMDATGSTQYTYDRSGHRVAQVRTFEDEKLPPEHLAMAYDDNGNLQILVYPNHMAVNYIRGAAAQVNEITLTLATKTQTVATDINYLPYGPLSSLTWGNGLKLTRRHDTDYRLVSEILGKWQTSYSYDTAGNIVNVKKTSGVSTEYTYDPLDRLSKEVKGTTRSTYVLDKTGNRTQRTTTSTDGDTNDAQILTYAPDRNRLSASNGQTLEYDESGNQLFSAGRRFVHDAQGRLSEVYQASVQKVSEYRYNALGQRVVMRRFDPASGVLSSSTRYSYDQQGQLLGQTVYSANGSKKAVQYWIWLDGTPLVQIDISFEDNNSSDPVTITYLHADHLNTPRLASNAAGEFVWRWGSDAYGRGTPDEDFDHDGQLRQVDLRFPGQLHDPASGLNYNYFRDYDPETGRYVQSDPIGLRGGLNTYGYVMGNPVMYSDTFGLEVDGIYQKSTGEVFLYDRITRQMVSGFFESGGKPYGEPVPDGEYTIYGTPRDDFFRLDPVDENPNDDINQANGRWGIRLHKPGQTVGCIAAINMDYWDKVKPFLLSTSTTSGIPGSSIRTIPILNRAGINIIIGSAPDTLTRYGTLYVVP